MTTGAVEGTGSARAVLSGMVLAAGAGTALAFAAGAATGIAAGMLMPRGPVTTGQALALLLGCLAFGGAAGWVTRARWAILLVPAVHSLVFVLVRVGASGPTVDLPRFDDAFGVLAFLVGRGVYAVLGLLPLAVGAWLGADVSRRLAGEAVSWLPPAMAVLPVAALAAWLLVPARTPSILGEDGEPLP